MQPTHLTLRQLQILEAVQNTGSMAEAGRTLHMTGPGVTQQIQQLEKVLGAPVYDRLGRRLKLTAAGRHALAAAHDVHARLAALAREMVMSLSRITIPDPACSNTLRYRCSLSFIAASAANRRSTWS